jgi:hypothetical protein
MPGVLRKLIETTSTENSLWDALIRFSVKKFSEFLELKVHSHVRKRAPLDPILRQMNTSQTLRPYSSNLYF